MRLPILAYGHTILKRKCISVDEDYPDLEQLIQSMWKTMLNANGCGLAASQIGQAIRLFIVDSLSAYESLDEKDRQSYFEPEDKGIKETFINAKITEYSKDFWEDEEGCLSIPNLFQKVKRPWKITIEYFDLNFEKKTKTFAGTTARMVQHEYDHTEGIMYLNYLSPLTKRLMESKLKKIARGQTEPKYPMKFV